MKKIFTFTALLLIAATLLGQAPAGFKYQAVLRDSRGNVKANVTANIKIDILQGSSSGNIVYSENHSVTTNMYGLINLEVGNGVATKGSFSAIDWGTSTYFIKIFVDGVEMGTDQLLSVPYALNAKTADKITGGFKEKDSIFVASPAYGVTSGNITNWSTAYDWGNHATAGYLKASSQNDISNWNTAFGWGNHAKAGYLTTEIDPIFLASPAGGITSNNISNWNTAFDWGDHATAGYLKAFTEIDPIFGAWDKSTGISITASQVSDLNSSVTNNAAVLENTVKNSYPATDKLKLAGIQDSAEVNVNADWNAISGDAQIVNKPILSTVAISGSYNDLTNKPVISAGSNIGDMQYWNGTAWVMVPIGQPGQFLKLNASNIPEWAGVLPSVITTSVSSITDVSSVSGGTVTSDGGGTITARGICFSTSQSPTTSNNTINSGAGTGSFVSNISGLSYATTYYLKAFATNSAGTSYGSEVNFKTNSVLPTVTTTAISSITQTTASSGGNITNDGGASISARGVCWSTSANPTTADAKTSDATGTGTFSSSLTGLTGNTTYYVRSYSTNSAGTSYGNEVSFKTSPILPTVTTTTISAISQTTATSGGNITDDGGASISARGVCWSTSANPTTANSKTTNATGPGTFTSSLTGLTGNTTYYVRSYSTNSAGTSYGDEVSFKTSPILPMVTTTTISAISQTTATSGGNITDDGGASISARGVCWLTSANPTIADSKTADGTGAGSFTSSLTGLTANTTYFLRAYATNSVGTAYGNEVSFKTFNGTVTDIDGNVYNTVIIGTQEWMFDNLKTTKYNDGTGIPNVTDDAAWAALTTGAYCLYNNDAANKNTYGALYNWYTVNTGKLAPTGWHVPTDDEWTILTTYLGGGNVAGGKLKEAGTIHWAEPNYGATNESGFTAVPGGYRNYGTFQIIGGNGSWWSSTLYPSSITTPWQRSMHFNDGTVDRSHNFTQDGFSVRCLKD